MKQLSEKSMSLYKMMINQGYLEERAEIITQNLNTDRTESRMMGYLYNNKILPIKQIADEMLAILSDRERIMKKKALENMDNTVVMSETKYYISYIRCN